VRILSRLISNVRMCRGACVSWMAAALAMTMLGSISAYAAAECRETICAEQGWTRATPEGAQTAAIYFSIINQGDAADTLAKASTTVAAGAMLHRSTRTGNIAQMDMVANVPLPAHDRVTFGPLGYHVMLTGLKAPLKEGALFPFTLDLASGRHLSFDIHVLGIAARGPNAISGVPGR
jgi:copper(I)-binding protein